MTDEDFNDVLASDRLRRDTEIFLERQRAIELAEQALGLETWWRNHYRCEECDEDWASDWTCQVDDECAGCGKSFTPFESIEIDGKDGDPVPDGREEWVVG